MKSFNIWNVWNVVINGTQMMRGEKSILLGHKCCNISVVLGKKKKKKNSISRQSLSESCQQTAHNSALPGVNRYIKVWKKTNFCDGKCAVRRILHWNASKGRLSWGLLEPLSLDVRLPLLMMMTRSLFKEHLEVTELLLSPIDLWWHR